MIKIVDNLEEANVVTHSGNFHADDIFSTILLESIFNEVYILRTYEIKCVNDGRIYYDIGGGNFDHHHINNNKIRTNKIPYSSFGLLWNEYGKTLIKKYTDKNIDFIFKYIDENFIMCIDALDNGVFYKNNLYKVIDISYIINLFNPIYDEDINYNKAFINACNIAKLIFNRIISKSISISKSKFEIEKLIDKSNNHILIMDEYMPYKEHILNSTNKKANDIYFVIYKSNRKGYTISTLPKSEEDESLRLQFPKAWSGLRNKDLENITGINGAIFCHKNLFIASAMTKKSAIDLALLAFKKNNRKNIQNVN